MAVKTEGIEHYLPLIYPVVTFIWGVATFFVGHVIGHRSAVKRDKRKEYNSLVSPVRVELLRQVEAIKNGDYVSTKITQNEMLQIQDMFKKPDQLIKAYQEYKYATSWEGLEITVNEYGDQKIGNTRNALSTAIKLLKILPLR